MPADREPVKTEDSRRLTFYLSEAQRRDLLSRMAAEGETSITRYVVAQLGLENVGEEQPA